MKERPSLDKPLHDELLSTYADLLRVGEILLDGSKLAWETNGSGTQQLEEFSDQLVQGLRRAQPLSHSRDSTLRKAAYWLCKATSFNYVLMEVIVLLQQRAGFVSTIQTRDEDGVAVRFAVDVLPDGSLKVQLIWLRPGNILALSPESGQKSVKGTLCSLTTQFPLPPPPTFLPEYEVRFTLKKPCTTNLAKMLRDRIQCTGEAEECERILAESPLGASASDELSETPSWRTVSSQRTRRTSRTGGEREVGELRIHLLRAEALPGRGLRGLFGRGQDRVVRGAIGASAARQTSFGVAAGAAYEWSDTLVLPVLARDLWNHEALSCSVLEVSGAQETEIGTVRLIVTHVIIAHGELRVKLPLASPDGSGSLSAALSLEAEFLARSAPGVAEEPEHEAEAEAQDAQEAEADEDETAWSLPHDRSRASSDDVVHM